MKEKVLELLARAIAGYVGIVCLSRWAPEVYGYVSWLAQKHSIFLTATFFFALLLVRKIANWVRIHLQLKDVGGKSQHHARGLKR